MKQGEKAAFRVFSSKPELRSDEADISLLYKIKLIKLTSKDENEQDIQANLHQAHLIKESGVSFFKEKSYSEAVTQFDKAFSLISKYTEDIAEITSLKANLLMNVSNCQNKQGKFSEAIETINKTLTFAEHPKCFYHRGVYF